MNSDKVKRYLSIICERYDLREDLFQFCILEMLEKDKQTLDSILLKSNKTIVDYFIGILTYQIRSNTSSFYKEYRNYGFSKNISISSESNESVDIYEESSLDDRIKSEVREQMLVDKINRAIRFCDPLKIDLFRMRYFENKKFREISEYYNINIESVKKKIKVVKNQIIHIINNESLLSGDKISHIEEKRRMLSSLRKADWNRRRIDDNKKPIDDKLIKNIIDDFEMNMSKKDISDKYQISYQYISKIIKQNDRNNN